MDELTHRNLMRLSATSRVATADASELVPETAGAPRDAMPLSDMLEMGVEALLRQFRRK
jgi:hypothetical protein